MSRQVSEVLRLIDNELSWSFSRSPGPGGQNVNKSNTQAHLRWELENSKISPEVKDLIVSSAPSRFLQGFTVIISSAAHRVQMQNKRACMKKLESLLETAFRKTIPRVPTKMSFAKKIKRREKKVQHSRKKQMRSRVKEESE
jgi:ribosome-associated protein